MPAPGNQVHEVKHNKGDKAPRQKSPPAGAAGSPAPPARLGRLCVEPTPPSCRWRAPIRQSNSTRWPGPVPRPLALRTAAYRKSPCRGRRPKPATTAFRKQRAARAARLESTADSQIPATGELRTVSTRGLPTALPTPPAPAPPARPRGARLGGTPWLEARRCLDEHAPAYGLEPFRRRTIRSMRLIPARRASSVFI